VPAKSQVPEKYDHAWFLRQPQKVRVDLLSAWFAAIARGRIESGWSTLGQRLEYVKALADVTDQAWAKAAGIAKTTLCYYLKGERAKDAGECDAATCRNILKLLLATKIPIDLPWIMGGSSPWMVGDGYWGRARWALGVASTDGKWETLANKRGLRRPELELRTGLPPLPAPPEAKDYAAMVAKEVPARAISMEWLMSGTPETPAQVRSVADKLFPLDAQSPRPSASPRDPLRVLTKPRALAPSPENEPWPMEWTPRLLKPLLKLVQNRQSELPEGVRDEILIKLYAPFAVRL
jgi:hypothetical protein